MCMMGTEGQKISKSSSKVGNQYVKPKSEKSRGSNTNKSFRNMEISSKIIS